jgi:MFS transporter, PHS family, inorganic phosphate transporter
MYGTELIVMIVATLGLTLGASGQAMDVIGVTIFWRIILGIGIGGDYPNSSVLVSEFSNVKWRGASMAAMFAAQGFGSFFSALISFVCVRAYRSTLEVDTCGTDCQIVLDRSWRIVYGMGIVPALIALFFRLTIPETIRYTLDISRNAPSAAQNAHSFIDGVYVDDPSNLLGENHNVHGGFGAPPRPSFRDFRRFFGLWKNGKVLLGTAGSWFVLDVAFVCVLYPSR